MAWCLAHVRVYIAGFTLVGFRSGYSKIRYLDILNILSSGSWRKQQKQDRSSFVPTLFPKTDHKSLMWEVSSLYLEERSIFTFEYKGCQEESEWQGLVSVPSLLYLPIILTLSHCSMTIHPPSKLASNTQVKRFLWVFISSWRLPNHTKLIINKCAYVSPVICFCPFNFQMQPEALRRVKENFPSLYLGRDFWTWNSSERQLPQLLPLRNTAA